MHSSVVSGSINAPRVDSTMWSQFNSPYVYSGGVTIRDDESRAHSLGQLFPIWCDSMGWAPETLLTQTLMPRLRLHAQTTWNSPRPATTYVAYDPLIVLYGHAPGFTQATISLGVYTLGVGVTAPDSTVAGLEIATFTEQGFGAGEQVRLRLHNDANSAEIGTISVVASGTTDTGIVAVPRDLWGLPAGEHSITATGLDSDRVPSGTITLLAPAQPAIAVSPAKASPGTTVAVTGSGFTPGQVTITWIGGAAVQGVVAANGVFLVPLVVPDDAAPGSVSISATDAAGIQASTTFEIIPAPAPPTPDDPADPGKPTGADYDQPLLRFSKSDGAHFYTASLHEAQQVIGYSQYKFEGIAGYIADATATPGEGQTPLHRFYKNDGTHFYTASAHEATVAKAYPDYSYEGIVGVVGTAPSDDVVPTHRFYKNTGRTSTRPQATKRARCAPIPSTPMKGSPSTSARRRSLDKPRGQSGARRARVVPAGATPAGTTHRTQSSQPAAPRPIRPIGHQPPRLSQTRQLDNTAAADAVRRHTQPMVACLANSVLHAAAPPAKPPRGLTSQVNSRELPGSRLGHSIGHTARQTEFVVI